jgi:signal transduction histidine kinase
MDADLISHALRAASFTFHLELINTKAAFIQRLGKNPPPDLVLSDFTLPDIDGYEALHLVSEKCPGTPFIFVTGTLGDEVAIETVKQGATDYVLKHRLSRLVPAVNRALAEARVRAEHRRAEQQLRESREQLRALSVHLQHVREEERIHIAREVHDELGQALTGLKLQLTWLTSRLQKNDRVLQGKARTMAENIDETIHTVRRIATELRPGVLDSAGLPAALEWQAHEFEHQTGIRCRVHTHIRKTSWDEDLNTAFFRIFQETLTNIIRHAGATEVTVNLTETSDDLVMEVNDDGRGILEAEIYNTRSIGLLGMRERAGLLGGEVRLSGGPGKGTTVRVRIPRHPGPSGKYIRHENTPHRRPHVGAARAQTHSH